MMFLREIEQQAIELNDAQENIYYFISFQY